MHPSTSMNFPSGSNPSPLPSSDEICSVCGAPPKSSRMGAPACLSCMLFFRRSILKNAYYICGKEKKCKIFYDKFRSTCRHCRFKNCLATGMNASNIASRISSGTRISLTFATYVPRDLMGPLVKLQQKMFEDHRYQSVEPTRRATIGDVNRMFKWSFNNAVAWASQFEPFLKGLSNEMQKCIVSEYGFAFFIIDQGYKSAMECRKGFWMLQNGTFLHSNYFHGVAHKEGLEPEPKMIRQHSEFVEFLEITIKLQFQALQVDEFEIAVLKTLLLFSNSFPRPHIFAEFQEEVEAYKNKCLEELMEHLAENHPSCYIIRFGNLLLLLGDVRNAIKVLYNQTKILDLFDSTKFDMFVRSFFLI